MTHRSILSHLLHHSSHHRSFTISGGFASGDQSDCGNSIQHGIDIRCAQDAWAPVCGSRSAQVRQCPDVVEFRSPYEQFNRGTSAVPLKDSYAGLNAATKIDATRGFDAAKETYLRNIREADGIDQNQVSQQRRDSMRKLFGIDSQATNIERRGGRLEDLDALDVQRHQVLAQLHDLQKSYFAPANTRVNMGLACIRTGDPTKMSQGERLLQAAKELRPEIARDPRLQQMIDSAYESADRVQQFKAARDYSHATPVKPAVLPPFSLLEMPDRKPNFAPLQTVPDRKSNFEPLQPDRKPIFVPPPVEISHWPDLTVRPAPVQQNHGLEKPWLPPSATIGTSAPLTVPDAVNTPTKDLLVGSQSRISDSEALNWLHGKYKHLNVDARYENIRQSQKAYDETSSSWNPFEVPLEQRAMNNRGDKLVEFAKGFRSDLHNLFDLAKQPRSYDSDYARQALTTIIKTSAQNMSNEAGNRSIAQESCGIVKELCAPDSPGRLQMIDAVRLGLTEASLLPSGAKSELLDGLELLTTGQSPALNAEEAGRLSLAALKHECDSMSRLGACSRPGESVNDSNQRQIRLIGLLNKFQFSAAAADLQSIATKHPSEEVRKEALKALRG